MSSPEPDSEPPSEAACAVAERVASLVHDLRNPLGAVSINAELVGVMLGDDVDDALADGLAALDRAVGELEGRLGDLDGYLSTVRRA